jgi:hypothetical protein
LRRNYRIGADQAASRCGLLIRIAGGKSAKSIPLSNKGGDAQKSAD